MFCFVSIQVIIFIFDVYPSSRFEVHFTLSTIQVQFNTCFIYSNAVPLLKLTYYYLNLNMYVYKKVCKTIFKKVFNALVKRVNTMISQCLKRKFIPSFNQTRNELFPPDHQRSAHSMFSMTESSAFDTNTSHFCPQRVQNVFKTSALAINSQIITKCGPLGCLHLKLCIGMFFWLQSGPQTHRNMGLVVTFS